MRLPFRLDPRSEAQSAGLLEAMLGMSELSKAYEPQAVESKWYQYWLDRKFFVADPGSPKPAYSIVIPPPNVTGVLHMGHVLNNTIQDILARKARMDGQEVLWLPGTDHAGISTEGMVVKQIRKEEKKSKQDLGRDEFLKRAWAWKEKHGGIIIEQLKKLGCSCDWSRERFTMDPDYVRCVQKVFVELYKKGLIYRGKRMVNWCPASLTALSDEEVEMEAQKGTLWYFKVEVVEKDGSPAQRDPLTPALSPDGGEEGTRASAQPRPAPSSMLPAGSSSPTGGEGQGEAVAPKHGPVTDAEGRTWLTIATTRPETIPGDTGIAVNPRDPRYARFIGKHAVRPLPAEYPREKKLIPIVADDKVDFEFGTGVLKVTPGHDKADFEIGQRHSLPAVDIMNPNATMNDLAGADLRGLDRFEARKVAVEKLKALGALVKEEPYENKIGISERAKVPIEPRLSEQWFLKYPSVEASKACVEQDEGGTGYQPVPVGNLPTAPVTPGKWPGATGQWPVPPNKMRFHPLRWAKVYDHWMTNIQDWCISRQLWWGHRIPVWTKRIPVMHTLRVDKSKPLDAGDAIIECSRFGHGTFQVIHHEPGVGGTGYSGGTNYVCVPPLSPSEEREVIQQLEAEGFSQDPDVLDTWFSSWLWPFATMGWPEQTETLKKFYPTTDLVTGPDIIFFWVARMIMAGYEFMGELPFRNVYFTGIIRDKQGRKMSKTLGNSPDPLELIAKYGADALRFGTMRSAPLGQDVLFDEKDVELGRNFCNKLWNACRFRQMQGGEVQGEIDPNKLRSDDKWILLKLGQAIREIDAAFAKYRFNEVTQTLYRFFWSEYCDWYVESCKAVLGRAAAAAAPSPLNGERAGVRGETSQPPFPTSSAVTAPPHLTPALSLPSGSGEGDTHAAAMRANVLAVIDFVLSHTLRLFHPFLPFITEELWHGMGYVEDMPAAQGGQSIMFAPWPKPFDADFRDHYSLDDCYLDYVNAKYDLVTRGRNLRREYNIASNRKVKHVLKPANPVPPHDAEVLKVLLNADPFEINPDYQPGKGTPVAHSELGELYLPLEGLIDVAAEITRLKKEVEKAASEVAKVEEKLSNPAFTQKVPPHILQEHQKRLTDWQARRDGVQKALEALLG
jgi:valyl-tRNA synthetase